MDQGTVEPKDSLLTQTRGSAGRYAQPRALSELQIKGVTVDGYIGALNDWNVFNTATNSGVKYSIGNDVVIKKDGKSYYFARVIAILVPIILNEKFNQITLLVRFYQQSENFKENIKLYNGDYFVQKYKTECFATDRHTQIEFDSVVSKTKLVHFPSECKLFEKEKNACWYRYLYSYSTSILELINCNDVTKENVIMYIKNCIVLKLNLSLAEQLSTSTILITSLKNKIEQLDPEIVKLKIANSDMSKKLEGVKYMYKAEADYSKKKEKKLEKTLSELTKKYNLLNNSSFCQSIDLDKKDNTIKEKDTTVQTQQELLEQKDNKIQTQQKLLEEKDNKIQTLDKIIKSKKRKYTELCSDNQEKEKEIQRLLFVEDELKSRLDFKDKQIETLKENNICVICLDHEIKCLMKPCHHFVCCKICAKMVRNCPKCNVVITQFLYVK